MNRDLLRFLLLIVAYAYYLLEKLPSFEELAYFSVIAKFATTAADGKVYQVEYYSLDVILSVIFYISELIKIFDKLVFPHSPSHFP